MPASVSASSSKQTIFTCAGFARAAHGVQNGRAVVIPQTDEAGDVGIFHERVLGVLLRANGVGVVRADVNDLDVGPVQRLFDAAGRVPWRFANRYGRRTA